MKIDVCDEGFIDGFSECRDRITYGSAIPWGRGDRDKLRSVVAGFAGGKRVSFTLFRIVARLANQLVGSFLEVRVRVGELHSLVGAALNDCGSTAASA